MALTMALLPFMSGVADAAVTTVDASPEVATNQLPDNVHDLTGTFAVDGGGATPIRFVITAGPNIDLGGNGANAADGTCTVPNPATPGVPTSFACSYTGANTTTTGTDTIRVFADNNSNNLIEAGEPFDDVTKTFSGPIATVTMTPEADQAAIGVCNPFTVTARDASGNLNPGVTIDVVLDPQGATQQVDFCTPAPNGAAVAAPATGAGVTVASEFATGTSGATTGQVTFGVRADTPGVINIRTFVDVGADDDVFTAGEPTDTSVKTFVAGGADSVTVVDAEPETDTNIVGEAHVITVTLRNASGDAIAGVTPVFDVTAGPNSAANTPANCTASNQSGVSTCTYTGTVAGTDTIVVHVNQTAGTTAGPDAGEPSDTVQKTYTAAPPATALDLTCVGTVAGGTAAGTNGEPGDDTCVNPTDDPTEVFTVRVTGAGGAVVPNALVRFTVDTSGGNTTDNDTTIAPEECTTAANGTCSATITNPNPAANDTVGVTATVAGVPAATDTGSKTWVARTPTTLTLTPEVDTNQTNSNHTVTANLADQFGTVVSGANIDFTVAGRNALPASGLDRTTDVAGNATFTYTDTGPAAAAGLDIIAAVADVATENDVDDGGAEPNVSAFKFWIPEATTPADVEIDMVACDASFGIGPAFTPANNESTATNPVGTTHEVCAIVRTAAGDPLLGSTVTFTSTGAGRFVSGTGANLGTTTTATVGLDGRAHVILQSDAAGTQSVTATAGTQTDTGTKVWEVSPANARNIAIAPTTATNPPGTDHVVTATVRDRFGNPVPGVSVTFTETGTGRFQNGTSTAIAVTGDQGEAVATTNTLANESGSQTITATIDSGATDCELAAGNPSGASAGNCTITATKVWTSVTGALYNPLTPARILDTRVANGVPGTAKVGAGSSIDLQVTGRGGIPATGVSAVVMNVTVVEPTAPSFLTVWPTGETRPLAANINFPFRAGEVVENLVKVKVGANGRVSIYNHGGTVHIGADVAGWYGDTVETSTGSRYEPLSPARILDTRNGTGAPMAPVGAAGTLDVQVTGAGGVPASGVTAVVMTVTAISPTAGSFLTAYPTGETRPLAANLNYVAGEVVTNRVIVKVGAGGKVTLYNHTGTVHLGADVSGFYTEAATGGRFNALSPARILDTRVGTGAPTGTVGAAGTLTLPVTGVGGVPATGVSAVVLNVTVVTPSAASFLTVYPAGETRPLAADTNFAVGQTISILVIAKVGANGSITMYNHAGTVHLGADVFGYFTAE